MVMYEREKSMPRIILEGNSRYSTSLQKQDIYTLYNKYKYHARILIDVKTEIGETQIQFISGEEKSTYWTKDELLFAFNEVYKNINRIIEIDSPIKIFEENIFYLHTIEYKPLEPNDYFQIEIPENKGIINKIYLELQKINEVRRKFENCKDKLSKVITWGPNLINRYQYNINRIIDYIYKVTHTGVVTGPNDENLSHVRGAINEMAKRKDTTNHNYQTALNIAQREIYTLDFPKFFKSELPNTEISETLDEIR